MDKIKHSPANIMPVETAITWIREAYLTGRHEYGDVSAIREQLQDMLDRLESNDWIRDQIVPYRSAAVEYRAHDSGSVAFHSMLDTLRLVRKNMKTHSFSSHAMYLRVVESISIATTPPATGDAATTKGA